MNKFLYKLKLKIQDEGGEVHLDLMAHMFKILVVTLLIFQLSIFLIDTSMLYMAINETMRKAQSEGMIRRDYFEEQLIRRNKLPSEVIAVAEPNFNNYAGKLGDKLSLYVEYEYKVSFSDMWDITLPIRLRVSGTNQGHYGTGYGGGW
ncbi:hypothetical protein [Alkaliphilus peptidifermentans]|uniref:TadE-like protein n=1 Tax=Alkaliphilus peptidifermentans DSM 18978 TaxID=1120976 RepID=A0A1G5DSW8_9FIRM|nr:hypothetical protein [Alkaliphilus peptidifermentans]SCY17849.1 hypothetical protein SAMN03080606_01006 [Alkaliphilus peptidifermentans DSM 18978]